MFEEGLCLDLYGKAWKINYQEQSNLKYYANKHFLLLYLAVEAFKFVVSKWPLEELIKCDDFLLLTKDWILLLYRP